MNMIEKILRIKNEMLQTNRTNQMDIKQYTIKHFMILTMFMLYFAYFEIRSYYYFSIESMVGYLLFTTLVAIGYYHTYEQQRCNESIAYNFMFAYLIAINGGDITLMSSKAFFLLVIYLSIKSDYLFCSLQKVATLLLTLSRLVLIIGILANTYYLFDYIPYLLIMILLIQVYFHKPKQGLLIAIMELFITYILFLNAFSPMIVRSNFALLIFVTLLGYMYIYNQKMKLKYFDLLLNMIILNFMSVLVILKVNAYNMIVVMFLIGLIFIYNRYSSDSEGNKSLFLRIMKFVLLLVLMIGFITLLIHNSLYGEYFLMVIVLLVLLLGYIWMVEKETS